MPSLERMHQIVAADPRAQAKFFLLMTELHYRYIIGLERLLVGRTTLARQALSAEDDVAIASSGLRWRGCAQLRSAACAPPLLDCELRFSPPR